MFKSLGEMKNGYKFVVVDEWVGYGHVSRMDMWLSKTLTIMRHKSMSVNVFENNWNWNDTMVNWEATNALYEKPTNKTKGGLNVKSFSAQQIDKVYSNAKKRSVTVLLKDGRKGTAKASVDDKFDIEVGMQLAYMIAMSESKNKHREQVTKAMKKVVVQ